MNIFITGINGFIGSHLATSLRSANHIVTGSVTSAIKLELLKGKGLAGIIAPLNAPCPSDAFTKIDVIIHCAHDITKNSRKDNTNGTIAFFNAAHSAGVKQQVFISSYSAIENAVSEYGQIKFELENFFLDHNSLVLKPGLVVGNGGLFQRISATMRKLPITPLIGGGHGKMAVLGITDLCSALQKLISDKQTGMFKLYREERATLLEFCKEIRKQGGFNTMFLPVPFFLLYAPVWILSNLKIPFPITSENLLGFKQNQDIKDSSNLDSIIENSQSLSEMVYTAIKQSEDNKS